MESAFARTLRGGIKGVAMVLDHEVQPLTRTSAFMCRIFYIVVRMSLSLINPTPRWRWFLVRGEGVDVIF